MCIKNSYPPPSNLSSDVLHKYIRKTRLYGYFWGILGPSRTIYALFRAPKSFLSKLFLFNTILLLQSFHLMCHTCIFSICEIWPQIRGFRKIGAPQKGGAPQIWVWPTVKYYFPSSKEHLCQFWCLYHYLQILFHFRARTIQVLLRFAQPKHCT